MSREEKLCRRLCRCLGLSIREFDDPQYENFITISPSEAPDDVMFFESYRDALSDGRGWNLRDLCAAASSKDVNWLPAVTRSFKFSSLEELDLQLSIRGF